MWLLRNKTLSQRNNNCKGPKVEACLEHFYGSKEASVVLLYEE